MTGSRWLPVLVLAAGPLVFAHDIITTKLTYGRDIQPIFASRCVACHSASASIPLTTYEQVRPWAVDIKEQVLSRAMPPWGAVKGFRALQPDQALTEDELTIIAAWVVGGTPEGDAVATANTKASQSGNSGPAGKTGLLPIDTRGTLASPVEVIGIQPLAKGQVASARITAQLPNGRIEPLLWLARYDGTSKRAFHFREPLSLPPGTVITSTAPLAFALQTATTAPQAR